MPEFIEISWTSGSVDEARKVSRHLVEERLVACSQIIPWIESIYMWNNELETTQESKIMLKTVMANYDKVKEYIERTSTYEVPEITFRKIDGGNGAYMKWLGESAIT